MTTAVAPRILVRTPPPPFGISRAVSDAKRPDLTAITRLIFGQARAFFEDEDVRVVAARGHTVAPGARLDMAGAARWTALFWLDPGDTAPLLAFTDPCDPNHPLLRLRPGVGTLMVWPLPVRCAVERNTGARDQRVIVASIE